MKDRIFPILIVLLPAGLWLGGLVIALLARLIGCKISAQGPQQCLVFGFDIGGQLYPLWGLGYYWVYALLWVPIGLIILAISRFLNNIDLS